MDYNELYHYGVKGMKWNVKRSQHQLTQSKSKSVSQFLHEKDVERTRIQKLDKIHGINQAAETTNGERIDQLQVSQLKTTKAHALGKDYIEKTKHKTFSMKLRDFGRKLVDFGKRIIGKLFGGFSK